MRIWISLLLAACVATSSKPALAEYPERLITLIVPVPPGGAGDLVARNFSDRLSELLKTRIVIDNRGGASGTIAATTVARAAPDGYTLLLSSITTHATAPLVIKDLAYSASNNFSHIGLIATVPAVLAVNSQLPVSSVAEFVKYAKERPGELNFASSGTGSPLQLWGEMFMSAAGVKLSHVPYKGSGQAIIDLLAGRVQIMFDGLPSLISGIQSKDLRPLAAMSVERSVLLPDIPTMTEAGYPSVIAGLWYGLSGPAKLPQNIVSKLEDAIQKIAAMPDFQEALKQGGVQTTPMPSASYARFIVDESEKYEKIAKAANISAE